MEERVKKCARCGNEKPLSDFRELYPGKHDSYCRPCRKEYHREYDRMKVRTVFWTPERVAIVLFMREMGYKFSQIGQYMNISKSSVFRFLLGCDVKRKKLEREYSKLKSD